MNEAGALFAALTAFRCGRRRRSGKRLSGRCHAGVCRVINTTGSAPTGVQGRHSSTGQQDRAQPPQARSRAPREANQVRIGDDEGNWVSTAEDDAANPADQDAETSLPSSNSWTVRATVPLAGGCPLMDRLVCTITTRHVYSDVVGAREKRHE